MTTARQEKVRPSASSIARDGAGLGRDASGFPLDKREVWGLREEFLHRAPIEFPVGLSAWSLDGGALAAVEHAKLNASRVGSARHHSVERVDLTHQVTLAQAADGRVAGHLADRRGTEGHQRCRGAATRRRGRGFASGMSAADDNDVKSHGRASACFT